MDSISIKRIQTAHPIIREELFEIFGLINKALSGKAKCRLSYVLRTFPEQAELYAQGRTKPGKIVTKAPAGLSMHNYGLACDIVLLLDRDGDGKFTEASWDTKGDYDGDKKADWMEIVEIFRQFGWTWGGDWNNNMRSDDEQFLDFPHFEKKVKGLSVRDLLALHNAKKFIPGTQYVQI